jgi:hypothetical protein
MKKGDKITAINRCRIAGSFQDSLIIGKEYEVLSVYTDSLTVLNELGEAHLFYFKTLHKFFQTNKKDKESLLSQADKIVNGDRNEQYGDAKQAFSEYSDILKTTFNILLTPEEICKVMMAIKLGRLKYKFKEDSVVDLMGYSEILNRLQ